MKQKNGNNGMSGDSWRELMRQDGDDTSRRCYTETTPSACTVCVEGATLAPHADTNHFRAPAATRVDLNRPDALEGYTRCVTHPLHKGTITYYTKTPDECATLTSVAVDACHRSGRTDCDACIVRGDAT